MKLYEFESNLAVGLEERVEKLTDEAINERYENGEARIITEQGAVKLSLVKDVFTGDNYQLKPKYQRRITWDAKKRSKLIESFIMNVPIPPVFVYETDFDKYQVMDGLQRITAIIDFYNDMYELEGLVQWSELNGRKYTSLPQKIREGIDRRQLSVITLLKESSKTSEQEDEMKKMVFERLNTGGVTLEDQEIRNALYDGPFNDLCIKLSRNESFRRLWSITPELDRADGKDEIDNYDQALLYTKNRMYNRMFDVELVLRYFSMRHIDEFNGKINKFLDLCLQVGNKYKDEQLSVLREDFENTIEKAERLFGDKAFCQYVYINGKEKWTAPQKMIYDPLMLVLNQLDSLCINSNMDRNIESLETFYNEYRNEFDGKHQSKSDICKRVELFRTFINTLLSEGR